MTRGEFGYPAARTSMDLPVSQAVMERLDEAFVVKPVAMPTTGGSVPLYAFTETLGVPTISVPTVNHDNNQHLKSIHSPPTLEFAAVRQSKLPPNKRLYLPVACGARS